MKDIQNQEHDRQLSGHFDEVNENGLRSFAPPPLQLRAGPGFNHRNPVMAKMEEAFDSDFSAVQMHLDSGKAAGMGALAFAQGNDIHFAPGQYNPSSQSGQELIGHELAHVVQQRNGRVGVQAKPGGIPVNQDPGLEAEADAMGKLAAQGMKTGISSGGNDANGPAQMKKHPLKLGGGDEWYGKDDSYWDVKTQLRITPNGKGTMEFDLEDGDVFQASAKIAQEMEAVNGVAEIVSNTTTLVDNVWSNPQKDAKSVSSFGYSADPTNRISLRPIGGTGEKIPIQGPYSMRKSLEGSDSGRIRHKLQFVEVPWDVTETSDSTETETSNSGGDFSTGASQENKVNLQVKLNEEDLILLLGGKPVFKGTVAEAKKSGALVEAVGGEAGLEGKDRVNVNVDGKTAQRIAGDFNYAWTDSSTSTETVTKTRSYQDPGDAAQENHTVVVAQALESLGKVNFEEEDQAELSEDSKNLIREFMKSEGPMLAQVLTKGSGYYIGLAGHATSTGSEQHNKHLSGIRAMQVRSFMIMEHPKLLPIHFMDIKDMGKSESNPTIIDPVDRRVEIRIGRKQ